MPELDQKIRERLFELAGSIDHYHHGLATSIGTIRAVLDTITPLAESGDVVQRQEADFIYRAIARALGIDTEEADRG